jgi:hypothetical protein
MPEYVEENTEVEERWLMRNGSIARIAQRGYGYAIGCVDDSDQIYCWHHGKTTAGPGYDLIELAPTEAAHAD